jgi:hypothetical protein
MARKIFEGLGPGSLIPHRGSLPLADPRIGPEEGFVLSRIDGHTSLEEVLLLVPFEEQVAMVILRKLWEIGAIDVPGVARVLPPQMLEHKPDPIPQITVEKKPQPPAKPKVPSEDEKSADKGISAEQEKRINEVFAALEHRNAFELLEIAREADAKELKRAYFKLSKEFHPDRFYGKEIGDYKKKLSAIFQAIKAAFELLSDENRRSAYIDSLR